MWLLSRNKEQLTQDSSNGKSREYAAFRTEVLLQVLAFFVTEVFIIWHQIRLISALFKLKHFNLLCFHVEP